jgi:dihydroorotate dehydrogenase/NAD-dependent dihydropyrimidine dehydrogenase PreA subunit
MKTNFLGYSLKSPIIAASSPITENTRNVTRCEEHGAGAVILKTASITRLGVDGKRRCRIDERGFWAKSSFDREILTLAEGERLTKDSVSAVSIPVIASFTELSMDPAVWAEGCRALERAGAFAIQLDLFYIENMLSIPDFGNKFVEMLKEVQRHLSIPLMPKLNVGFPAAYAAHLLKEAGIQFVSLLDSIKVPPPMRLSGGNFSTEPGFEGDGLSLFGPFMFPLTRQYTWTLAREGFSVCAGGGVDSYKDAVDLMTLGASCVQIATAPLLRGYDEFHVMNEGVNTAFLEAAVESANDLQLKTSHGSDGEVPAAHVPYYNVDKCDHCGICSRQTFCSHIKMTEGFAAWYGCEGCGLCEFLCPRGAISFGYERIDSPGSR